MREGLSRGALRVNAGCLHIDRATRTNYTGVVRTIPSSILSEAVEQRAIDRAELRVRDSVWVYVIHWQDRGPSKVGVAGDPLARKGMLQTGNPYVLKLAAAFGFPMREQALETEQAVLTALKSRRLSGEWLDATPLQVRQAIQTCVTQAHLYPLEWGERRPKPDPKQQQRARAAMAEYRRLRDH